LNEESKHFDQSLHNSAPNVIKTVERSECSRWVVVGTGGGDDAPCITSLGAGAAKRKFGECTQLHSMDWNLEEGEEEVMMEEEGGSRIPDCVWQLVARWMH
jgi:hypothetical protein